MCQYVPVQIGHQKVHALCPLQEDKSLLLETLQSVNPSIVGLRFKSTESEDYKIVNFRDGHFIPPDNSWAENQYIAIFDTDCRGVKRTPDDLLEGSAKKRFKGNRLHIKDLPNSTTKEDIEAYFSTFGPITDVYLGNNLSGEKFGFFSVQTAEIAETLRNTEHAMQDKTAVVTVADPKLYETVDVALVTTIKDVIKASIKECLKDDLKNLCQSPGTWRWVKVWDDEPCRGHCGCRCNFYSHCPCGCPCSRPHGGSNHGGAGGREVPNSGGSGGGNG